MPSQIALCASLHFGIQETDTKTPHPETTMKPMTRRHAVQLLTTTGAAAAEAD
jgi:hypothetical protein